MTIRECIFSRGPLCDCSLGRLCSSLLPLMKILPLFLAGLAIPGALLAANSATVKQTDDRVRVEIDGKLFTEYVYKGAPKPYLYPVLAVDGTEMMRHFPMKGKGGVPGEIEDHPHHRSLWFTHGNVNGFDFWGEGG